MFLLLQPGRISRKLPKNRQKRDGWSKHSDGRIKTENAGTRRQGQKAEQGMYFEECHRPTMLLSTPCKLCLC